MNSSLPKVEMTSPGCEICSLVLGRSPLSLGAKAVLIFVLVINIVTFPFTTFLNALVIIAVKTKSRLRANKPNVLLACMAISDLVVGVVVQPLFIALIISLLQFNENTRRFCALSTATKEASILLCSASLIHLVLISGERYLALKHPFVYSSLVTEARLLVSSALAWFLTIILHIQHFLGGTIPLPIISQTFIFLSIVIIAFLHIVVYIEIRRLEKRMSTQQVTEDAKQEFLKDKKAFYLTSVIVSALLVCYFPVSVNAIVLSIYRGKPSMRIVCICVMLSNSLVMLNSLFNPVIYSARMRQFCVAFIELTCRTTNINEAEQIEMRMFGSANAVVSFETHGQENDRDQQNEDQENDD